MTVGGLPVEAGSELLNAIRMSKNNRSTNLVALTAFEELYLKLDQAFADAGVLLVHYDVDTGNWETTLSSLLRRCAAQPRCDFLIVCALEFERDAFERTRATLSRHRIENGLDVRRIEIGEHKGSVVLLPRSGLVNGGVVTAAAIERYRPKLVAVAGVCAGVEGRAKLGQVLVCGTSWEYQVGKRDSEGFKFEPYQTSISEPVRQELMKLCRSTSLLRCIYAGGKIAQKNRTAPKMATIVSGSAVIANDSTRIEILGQHRKIDGLEMEISAIFRAVELLDSTITVVAAKGVADFADENKNDDLQNTAAVASSRFIVEAIQLLINDKQTA